MNNWPTKKLGEVTKEIIGGGTPRRNNLEYWNGDIPWMTIDDINDNFYVVKTKQFISKKGLENSNAKLIPPGSVILSCTASVGNVAINKIPLTTNQQFNSFVCNDEIVPEFLAYVLILKKRIIESLGGVTTFPFISKSIIAKIKIPLPPLLIQKQIVERLDKIAEAQKLNDGLIQKTDELFQSLLHKELNPHTKKFSVGVNPAGKNWEVKKLGDIAEVKGGKRIPKGMNFASMKTNHPYLRVTDFVDNSIKIDDLKYIDEQVFRHIKRYIISSKDIYISIAGTIGLVGKIQRELEGANLTENAAKLLINEKIVDRDFLIFCLSTNSAKNQIKIFTQAVGVPKLALERIEKIKIPIPFLEVQKQIVAKLSAVQDYKKQLLEQKSKLKELFDSALSHSMKN